MELRVGVEAPAFRAERQDGSIVSLSDFSGRKLLLYFYPKDNTPGCTAEACSLRDGYEHLRELGVEVLGVSPDSHKSHVGFIAKHTLPFSLITDADHAVSTLYGAWGEKKRCGRVYMGMIRRSFLIDEQGLILHIFDNVKTASHAEQVLSVLGVE